MSDELLLLHTADIHVATFDALAAELAPSARLRHDVRADWLAQARETGISDSLAEEIGAFVAATSGPVMVTCSTLGETAEAAGALRVDRPMMQAAATSSGPILLVCALESTAASSRALLQDALDALERDTAVIPLVIETFWPLFESGDVAGYHAAIAAAAIEACDAMPDIGAIVLAQVSMAPVEHLLDGLGVPVFSAPRLALERALKPLLTHQSRASLGEPITT